MFNYDQKFVVRQEVDIFATPPEYLAQVSNDVLLRAFLMVAKESISEHGVNIKTVLYSYEEPWPVRKMVVCAAALVSHPKDHMLAYKEPLPIQAGSYVCIWCGAKNPKDDIFHSGTCENCGGPKV